MACKSCREKKVKCDKARPNCSYCTAHRIDCLYEDSRRQLRARHSLVRQKRLNRDELLQSLQMLLQSSEPSEDLLTPSDQIDQASNRDIEITLSPSVSAQRDLSNSELLDGGNLGDTSLENLYDNDVSCDLVEELLRNPGSKDFGDDGSLHIEVEGHLEYIGPCSGLSLLSAYGIAPTINAITEAGCEHLLHHVDLRPESILKMPETGRVGTEMVCSEKPSKALPPPDTAAIYIDAFFKTCQVVFPVVRRSAFEAKWREHLLFPSRADVAWYTLYNAVLAVGSHAALSACSPASYRSAKEESWGFFRNALYMQLPLISTGAGLMAVQALCVMMMFAENLGHPNLAYSCFSLAVQVTHSKGLHIHVNEMDPSKRKDRERLFWVIYVMDKITALQVGRPFLLANSDMSCSFPERNDIHSEDFSNTNMDLLYYLSRYAYICTKIQSGLYSAQAMRTDPMHLLHVRDRLVCELNAWRDSIHADFHAKTHPFRSTSLPSTVKPVQAVVLRVSYACGLGTIHRRFSLYYCHNPYSIAGTATACFDPDYLEAAREIILLTGQMEMENGTPYGFFIYYPFVSMVTLFTYVVLNPLENSVREDIALLTVVTGLLARLEFITSGDLSFPGVCHFTNIATRVVSESRLRVEAGVRSDRTDSLSERRENLADNGSETYDRFGETEVGLDGVAAFIPPLVSSM